MKEFVRVIRAPAQFFFLCVMTMAAAFLVGKLNSNPSFEGQPSVNTLSMMALAVIACVQAVELYGDEADRLSYFRESARARNDAFLLALYLAKQITSIFYLFWVPALFGVVFHGVSDTFISFGQYYLVLVGGYWVSQSYGHLVSTVVSPQSKQLIGSVTVLILCFLSGSNPTLSELGGMRVVADLFSFTRYQVEMLYYLQSESLTPVFAPLIEDRNEAFGYSPSRDAYVQCWTAMMIQGAVARFIAFFFFALKDRYKR